MDKMASDSAFSKSLQAAATATARTTPQDGDKMRLELVERLKQQVSEGTYQPDAAGISKRVIDKLLESE